MSFDCSRLLFFDMLLRRQDNQLVGRLMRSRMVVRFRLKSSSHGRPHALAHNFARAGLGALTYENVLKVVDQPHPTVIKQILIACGHADFTVSSALGSLWALSPNDASETLALSIWCLLIL